MPTWLYHLQHRLALTRNESLALLTLAGLFLVGIGAQTVQRHTAPPLPPALVASEGAPRADSLAPLASPEPAIINVNTASVERLQELPGIGPALSGRIERYRAQSPFDAIEDLRKVRGIGPKTLEALRPLVSVAPADGPTPSAAPSETETAAASHRASSQATEDASAPGA